LVSTTSIHGVTTQKNNIFILTAMRTSNLVWKLLNSSRPDITF
jgi:hypothetical protein